MPLSLSLSLVRGRRRWHTDARRETGHSVLLEWAGRQAAPLCQADRQAGQLLRVRDGPPANPRHRQVSQWPHESRWLLLKAARHRHRRAHTAHPFGDKLATNAAGWTDRVNRHVGSALLPFVLVQFFHHTNLYGRTARSLYSFFTSTRHPLVHSHPPTPPTPRGKL